MYWHDRSHKVLRRNTKVKFGPYNLIDLEVLRLWHVVILRTEIEERLGTQQGANHPTEVGQSIVGRPGYEVRRVFLFK